MTINDPGNADLPITVGSTHRDMPHTYGVSYFSSKGPTGDGRAKPDLVAPGRAHHLVCRGRASPIWVRASGHAVYVEDSGTSMAAPHVSGAIAAFLSIRQEFIGQPEKVKQIFTSSATSLGRERYFEGHGLVDLMRAIQSVVGRSTLHGRHRGLATLGDRVRQGWEHRCRGTRGSARPDRRGGPQPT